MKVLDRYILGSFFRAFFLVLLGFVSVYVVIEISQRIRTFIEHDVAWVDIFLFYQYKMPLIYLQMLPVVTIITTLMTMGGLARNNEVVVIRASGIGLFRLVLPVLCAALLISLSSLLVAEFVMPQAAVEMNRINHQKIRKLLSTRFKERNLSYRTAAGWFLNIKSYFPVDGQLLQMVMAVPSSDPARLERHYTVERAFYEENKWTFLNVVERKFDERGALVTSRKYAKTELPLSENPQDLSDMPRRPSEMSYRELATFIEKLKRSGKEHQKYFVDLYTKVSFPMTSAVIVLLAIPFTLSSGRSGSRMLSIAIGIGACFVYWGFYQIFSALGQVGVLPPLLSVWLAHLLFGGYGVYALWRA